MKRGFTLIELLATILILGIIALIATPIFLDVIGNAKKSADENSIKLYLKAVNEKLVERRINNSKVDDGDYSILENGDICLTWSNDTCIETLGLEVSNFDSDGGQVTIEDGNVTFYTFLIGDNQYDSGNYNLCFNFVNGSIRQYYSHVNNDSNSASCPTNVSIPAEINDKKVTSIYLNAFKDTAVTSVTVPSGVTSIGNNAFRNCTNLTSISIPDTVETIGNNAFSGDVKLTSISIPNTVTSIGRDAFSGCSGLTSITLPSNLTTISEGMFSGCSSLTSISIPSSVTSIGNNAFRDCSSLTSITLPSGVTQIADRAFINCSSLTSLPNLSNITSIGREAFSGCSSLTSVSIPNSVISIGESAFANCSNITSATLPSNLNAISGGLFSGCSKLSSITIPNTVTSIGTAAFGDCTLLTQITIPSNVTSIGVLAFRFSGLTSADFKNPNGWYNTTAEIPASTLSNTSSAASYLKNGIPISKTNPNGNSQY